MPGNRGRQWNDYQRKTTDADPRFLASSAEQDERTIRARAVEIVREAKSRPWLLGTDLVAEVRRARREHSESIRRER